MMSDTDYYDTSALIPYYCPEPLSDAVQALLMSGRTVTISALVDVEMASALSRLVRMGQLREEEAARIHNAFAADVQRGCYRYLPMDAAVFGQATQWLLERASAVRALDALHLARAALAEARLVTVDKVLAEAAQVHGVSCLLVC